MFAWYGFLPPLNILLLPAFLALGFLAALGVGLLFSALTVRYRDIRYIIPFLVQFGLYATPVGYSTASIPVEYRWLFGLNPMVGVIEGFRWAILGGEAQLHAGTLLLSIGLVLALLWVGIAYFRRVERTFADVV